MSSFKQAWKSLCNILPPTSMAMSNATSVVLHLKGISGRMPLTHAPMSPTSSTMGPLKTPILFVWWLLRTSETKPMKRFGCEGLGLWFFLILLATITFTATPGLGSWTSVAASSAMLVVVGSMLGRSAPEDVAFGVAVVRFQADGSLVNVGTASGSVPGKQTVPRSEMTGLLLALLHTKVDE